MTSNTLALTSTIYEGGEIDRERIVNGDSVPDEYFCPICQYLLWKPRSCSSCQQLFCEKCIRTWLENPNSGKRCPFRCEPFEDRRCPPYVQSLLSRLNIHCPNEAFGCAQILSYDQLEHHETVECQYLSRKCVECDKPVLLSKLEEHCTTPGLCAPCPIKCTICQNYIEKLLFREHFHQCCQRRIAELMQSASLQQNFATTANDRTVPSPNNGLVFFQAIMNTIQIFNQQKQMARFPTTLKGIDAVERARNENCGHVYHILVMLRFMLLNWTKIPYFLLTFGCGGFFAFSILALGGYTMCSHWAYKHVYRGPFFIILFSYILCYGTVLVCQTFSDMTIIFVFALLMFLWGCTGRTPLEILEMNHLFNQATICTAFCCFGILFMELLLLLIRFYYWLMPTYIAAGLVTFINFYVGSKLYHAYASAITTTTNQPLMTV